MVPALRKFRRAQEGQLGDLRDCASVVFATKSAATTAVVHQASCHRGWRAMASIFSVAAARRALR